MINRKNQYTIALPSKQKGERFELPLIADTRFLHPLHYLRVNTLG